MARTVFEVKDVKKIYKVSGGNDVHALNGVSLTVKENEFICVVGPSGCGKTTLLNIVAGLEPYDSGDVTIHGQPVIGPGPDRAVVFQQYALYPWMTVKKNVEFAIKFQTHPVEVEKKDPQTGQTVKTVKHVKYTKAEKAEMAKHYIKMVNLEGFEDSYPSGLSGGMKQRVALARGYATDADVLLMDEPYGQMDIKLRFYLEDEVVRLWKETGSTVLFITHNIEEAVYLAERILILSNKPTTIKEDFKVDLPRPRDVTSPEFTKIRQYVTDQIKWW